MAAFFRGLLLFFFGAAVGATGVLFFAPSFNVIVSRGPMPVKPVELAAVPAPAAPAVVVKASEPVPLAATPITAAAPSTPALMPASAVSAPAAVAATQEPAMSEPALDFKSISEHLILWPNTVTVKTATTVPVLADGKKIQDLALEVGTTLQLSKVLADGSLEVRAKGAKFEIKGAFTDFRAELGKRVSELVAKGTKIDAPFPVAPAPMPAEAAAGSPTAAISVSPGAAATSKGPLTLAQRVDVLFGNKPAAVAPVSVVAAPAAPAASVAPVVDAAVAVPTADPKGAEKGKELDRKINQLFK
jgi:hypothetical protein